MTAGRKIVSQSVHWGTPSHYVQAVKRVFDGSIALDPCSNEWSIVGAEEEWMLPDVDGLSEEWAYDTILRQPSLWSGSGTKNENPALVQKMCRGSHKTRCGSVGVSTYCRKYKTLETSCLGGRDGNLFFFTIPV